MKNNTIKWVFGVALLGLLVIAVKFMLCSLVVWALWNYLLTSLITSLAALSFGKAMIISAVLSVVRYLLTPKKSK
jgi:hypothetical protein